MPTHFSKIPRWQRDTACGWGPREYDLRLAELSCCPGRLAGQAPIQGGSQPPQQDPSARALRIATAFEPTPGTSNCRFLSPISKLGMRFELGTHGRSHHFTNGGKDVD
ncbi:uncharacterized protein TrAFT101_007871 [Trichoderma asperellum]|uniref:uncharacterized protein n=1 Tax=Trichoderma asperellum TaxID=101201 RepID=UPI00332ADC4B|nr:hypothetical protein TrAFT101_007871 [Trichoderma asperellum]